eukprot:3251615-Amphidinium_carterae.1
MFRAVGRLVGKGVLGHCEGSEVVKAGARGLKLLWIMFERGFKGGWRGVMDLVLRVFSRAVLRVVRKGCVTAATS